MDRRRRSTQQGSALQRVRGVLGIHCVDLGKSRAFKAELFRHLRSQGISNLENTAFSEFAWSVAEALNRVYGLLGTKDLIEMTLIQWDLYYALTGLEAQQDAYLARMYALAGCS